MWEGGKGERRRGHRGVIWHRKEEEEEVALRVSGVSSLHPLSQKRERNRRQEKGSLTRRGSAILERFWGEIFPLM